MNLSYIKNNNKIFVSFKNTMLKGEKNKPQSVRKNLTYVIDKGQNPNYIIYSQRPNKANKPHKNGKDMNRNFTEKNNYLVEHIKTCQNICHQGNQLSLHSHQIRLY